MMKRKANLIPLLLLFGMLLTGYTKTMAQDNVDITLNLPYSGNYNDWYIKFTNNNTSTVYEFWTDDSNWQTSILGTIPAGNYSVEFSSSYYPHVFEFYVGGHYYPGAGYLYRGSVDINNECLDCNSININENW
jgi:hypothetical protein